MAQAFDLSAISDQLPPNTGPPGLVPINGPSSNANANKNLRHVPCKFFRQGICQAGNSCPFSHNLEGSLGADKLPCKYFQKGNCKFGMKCALAHFLPDGTRVNSKTFNRRSERANQQYLNSFNLMANDFATSKDTHGSYSGNMGFYTSNSESLNPGTLQSRFSSFSEEVNPSSSFLEPLGQASYQDTSPIPQSAGLATGYSLNAAVDSLSEPLLIGSQGSFLLSLAYLGVGQGVPQSPFASNMRTNGSGVGSLNERSYTMGQLISFKTQKTLAGASPGRLSISSLTSSELNAGLSLQSPQSQFSTTYSRPFSRYQTPTSPVNTFLQCHDVFATDSAIVDDGSEEENAYFEDYIPASLNLILTPQERQRRKSRSQSGTLLQRPNAGLRDKALDDVFLME